MTNLGEIFEKDGWKHVSISDLTFILVLMFGIVAISCVTISRVVVG